MLRILAEALHHDLCALGIEIIDACSQDNIPSLYQIFHTSYGIPSVCVADADHKEKVKNFLKQIAPTLARKIESNSDEWASLINAVNSHNYYCCPPGQSIEALLAADVPDLVDRYFSDIREPSLNDWKNDPATRDNKVRGGKKRSELSDTEARVCRLEDCKTAFPREIAGLLAKTPERIPSYLRQAIERAVALAKGE